ncbi:hypothetical protein SAMN05421640_1420 [Ekhidna lutea]|uniref:YD repeat-containing protein n=1 Tax=Ekhidna lutea TaxID=447679 RepID=A0A239HQ12_EKHLU|nr:hypothetical protein [Ekhidna lutea]SNS83023.1 hypothetical protein SAMN05421640_1420 [Ekhidna lutea]
MKHLKNIFLLLSFSSLLFVLSCGSSEEVTVDLSDVEFSFDASNPPIDQEIINNLLGSNDNNGITIGSHLSTANAMTAYLGFFQSQPNAAQSNTPIGSCGGDALVYTYTSSVEGQTISIAYQICETSDKYIFQLFISENGSDFNEFMYAEETKGERRQGFMEIYAADISDAGTGSTPFIKYTWEESTDGTFEFIVTDNSGEFQLTINVNSDQSGSLDYVVSGNLSYEATWNATGTAGTYIYYDSEGNVTAEGNWPAQ